ncbi:MAG: DUF87 domain-containing protein, partial [Caldilineae bacterium]
RIAGRFFTPLPADIEATEGGTQVGVVAGDPNRSPVYLDARAVHKHKLLVGKTQKGKSTLMGHLALAHIRQGDGIVFLDPHGDAVRNLLPLIPPERIEDVLYIDFSARERLVGWNPLATTQSAPRAMLVESFLQAGEAVWDDYWGPRMESALRFALLALTEANEKLAAEERRDGIPASRSRQFTVHDIDGILTLRNFRVNLLERYVDRVETLRWFYNYFEKLTAQKREDVINPVLTKIHRLTGADVVYRVLGQSRSTFSFDEIVGGQKIVLVNLDAGSIGTKNTALLGTLFLTYLEMAIRRQTAQANRQQRATMAVIVDEFQRIPFDYASLLAELQKMGASFTIGTQSLAQLDAADPDLRGALLGNVDTLFVFQVSALDAAQLVSELSGDRPHSLRQDKNILQTRDLIDLEQYHCYLRTVREGSVVPPLRIETLPLPAGNPDVLRAIRQRAARYTETIAEIERMIDARQRYWYKEDYTRYQDGVNKRNEVLETVEKSREAAAGSPPPAAPETGIAGSNELGAGEAVVIDYDVACAVAEQQALPFVEDTPQETDGVKPRRRRSRSRKRKKEEQET